MSLVRYQPKEDAPVADAAAKGASFSLEVLDISPQGLSVHLC
jgi:hypothetical protein